MAMRRHGRPELAFLPTNSLWHGPSVWAPITSVAVLYFRDDRIFCGIHTCAVITQHQTGVISQPHAVLKAFDMFISFPSVHCLLEPIWLPRTFKHSTPKAFIHQMTFHGNTSYNKDGGVHTLMPYQVEQCGLLLCKLIDFTSLSSCLTWSVSVFHWPGAASFPQVGTLQYSQRVSLSVV